MKAICLIAAGLVAIAAAAAILALDNGADPTSLTSTKITVSGEIRWTGDISGTFGTPATGQVGVWVKIGNETHGGIIAVDGKFSFQLYKMPASLETRVEIGMVGLTVDQVDVELVKSGLKLTVYVAPAPQPSSRKTA